MAYHALTVEEVKSKTKSIFEKYGVKKAAVFGSCFNNEMQYGSDIDILIQMDDLSEPFKFLEIKRKIENKLRRKVDLISYASIKLSSIQIESEVIYERH